MGEIRVPLTPITDEDLPDNLAGADSLKAGAITADKIMANAITADKIAAGAVTADKITLTIDDIPDGTQYGRIKKVSLTADGLVVLDEVQDGSSYGKVKKSSLTANGLVILDAVQDGDSYAKVLKTNISAGSILLSKVIEDDQHKTVNATQQSAIDPTTGQLKTAVTPATYLGSPSSSGLYLGADYLGYYNGSEWKTYMDSSGNFYLSGSGVHHLSWNGTTLEIRGSLNADDITTGSLQGIQIATNIVANTQIILQSKTGVIPQLIFNYYAAMQHYIQESGGILVIDGNGEIHIGSSKASVSIQGLFYATYGITLNGITAITGAGQNLLEIGSGYAITSPYSNSTFAQSGSGTTSSGSVHISFGTSFNSNCTPQVVVTPKGSGVTSRLHTANIDYDGFDVGTADADCDFDWIAIGYI